MPSSKFASVLASLLLAPVAGAQEISFRSTEIAPGLHHIESVGGFGGGNMALSVGEDAVILIDDGLPPLSDELLETIAGITDRPVDFVINTHVHGDHVGGNAALAETGALIVAHDNIRKRLVEEGISLGGGERAPAPAAALPVITFSDAVSFHLNGQTARVIHVAHAHTDGDAMIHYQDLDVIHAGDLLFNGLFPFIDLATGGSVDGYLAGLERLLELAGEDTRIVAGHGPMANRADVARKLAMLRDARSRVAALVEAGHSEDEVVAADPLGEDYADWDWSFITAERMTRTLYQDLTRAPHAH